MNLTECNFSEDYKFIWLAPEKNATKTVAQVLSLYGCKYQNKTIFHPFSLQNYFFSNKIPQINSIDGYDILINVRNPYGRVYSFFKWKFDKVFLKDKENFKKFLYDGIHYSGLYTKIQEPKFFQCEFTTIKMESLYEDLSKLPFIGDKLTLSQLKQMTEWYAPIRDWEVFYDTNTKKIVYKLLEHQFDLFKYPSGL